LTAALNVELVYIILKGITRFSYITCDSGTSTEHLHKISKLNIAEKNGDATLTIEKIKIKNFDEWADIGPVGLNASMRSTTLSTT
jgi:hypothetical protein